MGPFSVPLEVAHPQGRRYHKIDALVDPWASHTVLPSSFLEHLRVVPHSARRFVLADGSRAERGFGRTWMRPYGGQDLSPVVFWDEDAQPLLGTVTLEIFCLGIGPADGRLMPVGALMLAAADQNGLSNLTA